MAISPSITLLAIGVALSPLCRALTTWWALTTTALLIAGILVVLMEHGNKLSVRPYRYTIPAAVIVGMTGISTVWTENLSVTVVYLIYMLGMFILFLAVKDVAGRDILKYVALVATFVAISCIVLGSINLGTRTGGITPNPNAAAGFMALTIFFLRGRQVWLTPLLLVGIYFTGYPLTIVVVPLLLTVYVAKKLRKIQLATATVLGAAAIISVVFLSGLYNPSNGSVMDTRIETYRDATKDVAWIGSGYDVREPYDIHNVPLLVAVESGIPAALAWVFIMGLLILRSKWRYPALMLFALSMFGCCWKYLDLSPYFWVLAGLGARDA